MMPDLAFRGTLRFPLQSVLRNSSGLIIAAVVAGACVGLGGQVWAIAERMAADPTGRALQTAQEAGPGAMIMARMAALPGDAPLYSDQNTAAPVTLAADAPIPQDTLAEYDRLTLAHVSYAPIKAGSLHFPDGALDTAWIDSAFALAEAEADAALADEQSSGMGRSTAIPAGRKPPTDHWRLVHTDASNAPAEPAPKPKTASDGWRFVPASFLPNFSGAARQGPKAAQAAALPAPADLTTTTTILFGDDVTALDRLACAELDRVAADLRNSLRPVTLHAFADSMADASRQNAALHRAWAVRAYLGQRGIALDRIRVQQTATDPRKSGAKAALRVDVTYRSG